MKRILSVLLTILVSVTFLACEATDPDVPATNMQDNQEQQPWYSMHPPVQPIRVEKISDAEKMLLVKEFYKTAIMARQPNRLGFGAMEEQAYEHMVNTFRRIGFLPLATCYKEHDGWVIYLPETKGEDVGVKSSCTCGDSYYEYYIYIPKEGYPASSITEYWDARLGTGYRKNISIYTVDGESQSTEVVSRPFSEGRKRITFLKGGFIISIICDNSSDIADFVNSFEIERISIGEAK